MSNTQQMGDSEGATAEVAPRLREFEETVRRLGTTGGRANPERSGAQLGLFVLVVGLVVAVAGAVWSRGSSEYEGTNEATSLLAEIVTSGNGMILVAFGLAVALVGGLVWLRNSLTRYLRHWLIRQIFEDRANTDRIVEAIERSNGR